MSAVLGRAARVARGRPRHGRPVARDAPRDQEILRIAADLFFRNGVDDTSLADIAREAGIARNSFYNYFRSKDEVCARIVAEVMGRFDLEREASRAAPAAERLARIVRARLEQAVAHPVEAELISKQVVKMAGPIGAWARKLTAENQRRIRRLVAEGQRDGTFVSGDPDLLAAAVISLCRAAPEWFRASGTDREAFIETMLGFVLRGLHAKRARR